MVRYSKSGYLLEDDVDYPPDLHDSHNDLPVMPERMNINGIEKLIPSLADKCWYVIYIRAFAQALSHGLILRKVHRVIEFNQSTWLEPYIRSNTVRKAGARNDFEKDFFKLMNNAVFCKMMENIRKHKDIKLVTTHEHYVKLMMKPNFKSQIRFGDNFFTLEMGKIRVVMNKPVYLGQAILDLSKVLMYKFHYDYSLPKYGDRFRLCYMDTDSFIYQINTED